ncbi:hypothetical protein NUTIK01_02400 [Novosphingobium sp. IK01]|uniref:Uncharacterized protein n=1 Tax=Novosphingobium pituita TaxID=3056842 RepID=A0ABQ6P2H7_9SPHN|nr:hypothetical protein NUTIK01_02400 [Novosphingobium sp. IK01]
MVEHDNPPPPLRRRGAAKQPGRPGPQNDRIMAHGASAVTPSDPFGKPVQKEGGAKEPDRPFAPLSSHQM